LAAVTATQRVDYTSLTNSRTPTSGWMTIGMNSSGTNQNAQITFPALNNIPGPIVKVELHIEWSYDSAGEGFATAATHKTTTPYPGGTVSQYAISGLSGTKNIDIVAGWDEANSFVLDLRSHSTSNSTSKGCSKANCYLIVTYSVFLVNDQPVAKMVCNTLPVHTLILKHMVDGSPVTIETYNFRTVSNLLTTMTGADASKAVAKSNNSSSYAEWKAFNNDYSDAYGWASTGGALSDHWIARKLDQKGFVTKVGIRNRTRASLVNGPNTLNIYAISALPSAGTAIADITKTLIGQVTSMPGTTSAALTEITTALFDGTVSYEYLLFHCPNKEYGSSADYIAIGEIYVEGYPDV